MRRRCALRRTMVPTPFPRDIEEPADERRRQRLAANDADLDRSTRIAQRNEPDGLAWPMGVGQCWNQRDPIPGPDHVGQRRKMFHAVQYSGGEPRGLADRSDALGSASAASDARANVIRPSRAL